MRFPAYWSRSMFGSIGAKDYEWSSCSAAPISRSAAGAIRHSAQNPSDISRWPSRPRIHDRQSVGGRGNAGAIAHTLLGATVVELGGWNRIFLPALSSPHSLYEGLRKKCPSSRWFNPGALLRMSPTTPELTRKRTSSTFRCTRVCCRSNRLRLSSSDVRQSE
jgi:hypothetical protein